MFLNRRIWMVASLLVVAAFIQGKAQLPQFVRERIEIEVCGNYCLLTGDYTFKNSGKTPCRSTLFYPLINQPELPFPDSIWVSDRNAQQTLDFKTTEKGVYFEIQIPSHAQRTYRVGYRQQTPAQKMEYILTTTHRWHRPLEQATFAIKIPQHLSLSELSFPYDQMTEDSSEDREGRYIIFSLERRNFMPEKNLVIEWERRKP